MLGSRDIQARIMRCASGSSTTNRLAPLGSPPASFRYQAAKAGRLVRDYAHLPSPAPSSIAM
jgi:hypothetical protein